MSTLIVGLSHRTASIDLLERATLTGEQAEKLALELTDAVEVREAVCLVTCNRLEIYADVERFHGGVDEIGTGLARATGVPLDELSQHLYVHYDAAAVAHVFRVASGLDSMAVGEAQILGQVRTAMRTGQSSGTVGRSLSHLLQNSLRVGKRAHSETRLDQAGPDLVEYGLEAAATLLGGAPGAPSMAGREVLVLGAGAMSGLAAASAQRAGAAGITVISRTAEKAHRLADSVGGRRLPLDRLAEALEAADVVLACAGATEHLVTVAAARDAQAARGGRAQVYVDVALPRDVEPEVATLPGVHVLDLERLGADLAERGLAEDLAAARALVADEVTAYLAGQRSEAVSPTVVALREMALGVVTSELERLNQRLDARSEPVGDDVRAELEQAVHRVVEKLLHSPTVRVKELAAEPGGTSYATALRALFNLGPEPAEAVTGLPSDLPVPVRVSPPVTSEHGLDLTSLRAADPSSGEVPR
ncbi:glutamyl-tRNA reductase [Spongisporangium articulatum]|uniref:Glutamyl-tRNA reductase n=1 Tax=Spongisporangium articulatum TaxID=3362603 RepID=A0ABW8ANM5_9ACTN